MKAFDGGLYIPNDTYFDRQFYLHNHGQLIVDNQYGTWGADINAPEAWEITKGNGNIVIAVIDAGVTDNHSDLPSYRQMRLPGSNFTTDPPGNDPSPDLLESYDFHGDACAGIAAAEQDNDQGISGVAPNCNIMPVKLPISKFATGNVGADAIKFAYTNGANIISNSWGYEEANPNLIPSLVTEIKNAIELGCIVIFAAGNTAAHHSYDDGFVIFPANCGVPGLISVAASDKDDLQADYSPSGEYSETIDIAAPSGSGFPLNNNVFTCDLPGSYGFNWIWYDETPDWGDNHLAYTGRMSGTSASTPQVAGCAALALSVNPNLSVRQMNDLYKFKSDKVGGYEYDWNHLLPGHSRELGYGRMNCAKVVVAASEMHTESVDLYVRDLEDDFGIEPNEAEYGIPMWTSPDIWVRNLNDGKEEHQNPIYQPPLPNYVYVRVTNKGSLPSTPDSDLKLYWAKASTAIPWPDNWNCSDPYWGCSIGTEYIPQLQPGEETIVAFEWQVPDPSIYGEDPWHFCLLARIESPTDPMSYPEGTSVYDNAYQNNNIAWKNVTVIENKDDVSNPGAVIALGNIYREATAFNMEFSVPQPCIGNSILDEAEVKLTLDDITYEKWSSGGKEGQNIQELKNNQILITGDNAVLGNLTYNADEWSTLFVGFNFLTDFADSEKMQFKYMATEKRRSDNQVIGGELFIVNKPGRELFDADAGDDKNISKNENITISAASIGEPAEYNWYNTEDSLIFSGSNLNVSLDTTTDFKLEVLALTDGFKDYDNVRVNVKQYEIISIAPNPANGQVTIEYDVEGAASAYLILTRPYDPATDIITIDVTLNQFTFDVSNYETGIYGIILVCNGQMEDQDLLLVE